MRGRALSVHLGALYSRPAELSSTQSSSTCGVTSFSARVLHSASRVLQRSASSSRGSEVVDPVDSSLPAAEEGASHKASGPVREVFCRVLPQPPVSPASRTAAPLKTSAQRPGEGSADTLSEALGLMYGGVHVVYSPQPPTVGVAGLGAPEEGGTGERKAARPPSSTPHLVPCPRLHAGLIPLYAPVVESADGTFLVRRLRGSRFVPVGE